MFAHAANFQLFEQSASLLGQGDAGTAVSDDPSVQYYNPAATAFFDKTALGLSGIYIAPHVSYAPTTATNLAGNTVTGQSGNPDQNAFVPALFIIQPINNRLVAGFGVTVPFGLSTNYGYDSTARYFATQSQVKTINFNPSLAYKLTDKFSVGAGFDLQYMKAILNQAIDVGTLTGGQVGDIYLDNQAHDWARGWNLGVFYKPYQHTKFGLSYRSEMHHHLHGSSNVENPPSNFIDQFMLSSLGIVDSDVSGDITLPAYTTLSAQQDITSRWSIMGDIERINWSSIKEITLNFSPRNDTTSYATLPPTTIPLNYHDTWRISVGQSYKLTPELTGRMGLTYDQSPVPKAYATARIPDNDRYWLTFGAGYAFMPHAMLNLGYAHIFFKNSSVHQSQTTTTQGIQVGTTTLAADYAASANLFGAQLNIQFG